MYKRLLQIISFIFLLGCNKSFDNPSEISKLQILKRDIARYEIVIDIPEDQSLRIEKRSIASEYVDLVDKKAAGSILDKKIISGETYEYIFSTVEGVRLYTLQIQIPLEIVSSDTSEIPSYFYEFGFNKTGENKIEVETLVLHEGFPFYTNGARTEFVIKNLISKNGEIVTFRPDDTAPVGRDGRSGGPLRINILDGEGNLKIIMRGQNGGTGATPEPLGIKGMGPKGAKGSPGNQTNYTDSHGGIAWRCDPQPGPGGTGGKGQTGLKGNQGMKGGDSGELYVSLTSKSYISVTVEKYVGQGGLGSQGGEGGYGGPGGDGGDIIEKDHYVTKPPGTSVRNLRYWNGQCSQAANGPSGPPGDAGPPGINGLPGSISKSCIKYSETETPDCIN